MDVVDRLEADADSLQRGIENLKFIGSNGTVIIQKPAPLLSNLLDAIAEIERLRRDLDIALTGTNPTYVEPIVAAASNPEHEIIKKIVSIIRNYSLKHGQYHEKDKSGALVDETCNSLEQAILQATSLEVT